MGSDKQTFRVAGPLPGLNEIIESAQVVGGTRSRKGKRWSRYATEKKMWTQNVATACMAFGVKPVDKAHFDFVWHEPHKRRDPDNITTAQKFILDGLVKAGVIKNDGWNEALSLNHSWVVDDTWSGVEVTIRSAT